MKTEEQINAKLHQVNNDLILKRFGFVLGEENAPVNTDEQRGFIKALRWISE